MSKDNKTPKEQIDGFLYIFQYIILTLAIIFTILTVCVFVYCFYYSLKDYYIGCGLSLLMCGALFFNYFTFGRFKEVRKKLKKGRNK